MYYNHNTMISHDSRRRQCFPKLLCLLAACLGANTNLIAVDAFGIATTPNAPTTTTKSKSRSSALDISTTIPHVLPQPSLVDRLLEEVKQKSQPEENKPATKTYASPAQSSSLHDNNSAPPPLIELDEQEVRKRKLEWAGRYTSVEALRQTFGANENKLWGDLQASTARRLYKTLLPRALLELSQLGLGQLQPQDLAPLAYQARVAAKLYARERCTVPARIGATLFDGFRQWLKYGKFQAHGMTYDQIWQKYADKICHQCCTSTEDAEEHVCLKILERSCVSNEGVDKLVLKDASTLERDQQRLLERIHTQLEQDMYELLLPSKVVQLSNSNTDTTSTSSTTKRFQKDNNKRPWSKRNHVLMVRLLARQRRLQQQREKQQLALQQQEEEDVLRP